MLLVLLFSVFAISDHPRRYKKPIPKDQQQFDEDLVEFNENDFDPDIRKIYKGSTSGRRHHTKHKNRFGDEDTLPEKFNFENTHEENGKKVCDDGYISGPVIDKRGCWRCIGECDNTATCEFPGTCVVKVPSINYVQKKFVNASDFLYVKYTVPDFKLTENPTTLYCKFDDNPVQSLKYDTQIAFCQMPTQTFSTVSISFDKESWSDEVDYDVSTLKTRKNYGKSLYWVVFAALLVCGIVLGYVFVMKRNKSKPSRNVQHPTQPLAYFPTVDEKEKKPYY